MYLLAEKHEKDEKVLEAINGGADDTVTIAGATAAGSEVRDGQTYNIYTLGDEGRLVIDDDVTVVI